MNTAWQRREEARRSLRADPNNSILRKAVKMAGKNLEEIRNAAVLSFLQAHVRKLEARVREGDQAGFYEHLKTMNLEGKQDRSSQFIKDEHGNLLRDVELVHERWVRWFHTLLNTKSSKLDPNIAESLDQWPVNMPLGVQPTMQELTAAIRSLSNGKAVEPDGVPVELFKITLNGDPLCEKDCSTSSLVFGGGGRSHNSGKIPRSKCFIRTRTGQSAATRGVFRWWHTPARYC